MELEVLGKIISNHVITLIKVQVLSFTFFLLSYFIINMHSLSSYLSYVSVRGNNALIIAIILNA